MVIDKMPQSFVATLLTFKKGNAPAVGVMVSVATALGKAPEAEGHVGRGVAVHAQQLAHGSGSRLRPQLATRGPVLALDVSNDDVY